MPEGRAKSLTEKLGIRHGQRVAVLGPPRGYDLLLTGLPDGVAIAHELTGEFDLIQVFASNAEDLEKIFRASKAKIKQKGMIWASWPKVSYGARGSLNGDIVREIGLKNGLVDVKICSLDETWSALKFVIRVKDRR